MNNKLTEIEKMKYECQRCGVHVYQWNGYGNNPIWKHAGARGVFTCGQKPLPIEKGTNQPDTEPVEDWRPFDLDTEPNEELLDKMEAMASGDPYAMQVLLLGYQAINAMRTREITLLRRAQKEQQVRAILRPAA